MTTFTVETENGPKAFWIDSFVLRCSDLKIKIGMPGDDMLRVTEPLEEVAAKIGRAAGATP